MSLHDVGSENLPNVYIDKIEVANNSVTITCLIKDFCDKKSWYNREQMGAMRVKLGLIYSGPQFEGFRQALNTGVASLYDYQADQPGMLVQTRKANDFVLGAEDNENNLCYYYSDFTFEILGRLVRSMEDVVVYAASYVGELVFGVDSLD